MPLRIAEPDVEVEPDHVDVGRGLPRRAGMRAVGITEGNVNSGEFLILQDVADDSLHTDVCADGKLTHAIGKPDACDIP